MAKLLVSHLGEQGLNLDPNISNVECPLTSQHISLTGIDFKWALIGQNTCIWIYTIKKKLLLLL
jgi:hypothetical protein